MSKVGDLDIDRQNKEDYLHNALDRLTWRLRQSAYDDNRWLIRNEMRVIIDQLKELKI